MRSNHDLIYIQSYYTEKDGGVWLVRSVDGGEWEWIKTPYDKIPYVITEWMTNEEYKLRQKNLNQ